MEWPTSIFRSPALSLSSGSLHYRLLIIFDLVAHLFPEEAFSLPKTVSAPVGCPLELPSLLHVPCVCVGRPCIVHRLHSTFSVPKLCWANDAVNQFKLMPTTLRPKPPSPPLTELQLLIFFLFVFQLDQFRMFDESFEHRFALSLHACSPILFDFQL